MKDPEFIFIFILFTVLLSLMLIIRTYVNKSNTKLKYRSTQKLKRIGWFKVLKFWFITQCISYFCSIDNKSMSIISTIGIPIVLLMFILSIYFFSLENDTEPISKEEEEDFLKYKKQFDRDQKIKKILK